MRIRRICHTRLIGERKESSHLLRTNTTMVRKYQIYICSTKKKEHAKSLQNCYRSGVMYMSHIFQVADGHFQLFFELKESTKSRGVS